MIRYACDRCGIAMTASDPRRYIVKFEIYAATSPIELTDDDLNAPGRALSAVLDTLSRADPNEIEDQTYRGLRFDVCDTCRRMLLDNPLGG